MNKVLTDKFYHKVKDGTPLADIPKPFQVEVQKLLDGVEEGPKEKVEIGLGELPVTNERIDFLEDAILNMMMEGL